MPKISIVVPVYNTDKYLYQCVDSILAQTFSDFEILLINDGSTDKSGVICDEYAEKDFRVRVYHKVNGGVTSARRLGVEKSLGEWISFVDSDDIDKSDYCDVLIREIENDVDIIATRISNEKIKEGKYSNYEFIKNILLASIARGVPAKLYRRSLFTNEIFCLSPEFRQGEDEIMNLRVGLYAKNIKVKAKNVYTYRHNLESVTNTTKFSLQYEEMLMGELKNSLGNLWQRFDDTLKARNLLTLENLIVCRVSVPYNRPWVLDLINWGKGKKLSFREWCVLNIRHNLICKYILAVEKRLKKLFKRNDRI